MKEKVYSMRDFRIFSSRKYSTKNNCSQICSGCFFNLWYINLKKIKLQVILNLFPQEKCAKLDDEVKELLKLLNRKEEKLTATLTESQKETFEKYKDCNREISEISEREIFLNGFRLGARLIIDVVNN